MPNSIAGPLTMADINRMLAVEYHWHEVNNAENLKAALNPVPPPPPPTPDQLLAQKRAEQIKELVPQFDEWLKTQKHDQPGSLTWEMFRRDHAMRIFLEEHHQWQAKIEAVARFLEKHPEYVHADSNKDAVNDYLSEHDLPVTFETLERAFKELVAAKEITIDESKIVDPDRPETRAGVWRNGRFIPNSEDASTGTVRQFPVGQSTPGASDEDVTIRKRPEHMTASEFAEACRKSKTFREKMNAS
jgi:hypothetical protein